ncbi:FeS cluster assembly protein SufB [Candidatus Calditenuaceae archaeon HR02]|nr:FeS cluster assembly protein SufB [Candidatus Calditenuaceae archaeon HR02]
MTTEISFDYSKYNFRDEVEYKYIFQPGISERVVEEISRIKDEPEWMTQLRLKAYRYFVERGMPTWGADLSSLDFGKIRYYVSPTDRKFRSWEEVPEYIKRTFDRLGIPEAERKFLAGVGAQYDSEVVYHNVRKELEKQGVIFCDMDTALREYPSIVKRYFGTVVPPNDNKFAALNTAVWSGGSFVYVPEGVHVEFPLQAYFRINAANVGQFERTLIIAEPGSKVHYIEGCTAPIYSSESLHSAVVEIIAMKGAYVRYTTLQNWSTDVYNLVTKRAFAYEDAVVEWVDANIGCLVPETAVFTNNDVKKIRDVEVGDLVYTVGPDLRIRTSRVVGKKSNPPRPVYKLTTANYREIVATDNHPFLTLSKEGRFFKLHWRMLRDIKPGDLVGVVGMIPDKGKPYKITFKPSVNAKPIKWPPETTDDLMWLIGFYLGDGYLDGEGRVCFAVAENDPAAKRVKTLLSEIFGVDAKRQGNVLRVNSKNLAMFLTSLGLAKKAREKRIPKWVFKLPRSQKLALIQGYIAADGYVRSGHKNLSVCSVNKKLLEDTKLLAITCGLNPLKISKWQRKEKKPLGRRKKTYTHYFLYFSDQIPDTEVYFVPVIKIEPAGEKKTYDIEVEGTANFIAQGMIVHNSKVTMKYPSVYLLGRGARAEILSVAFAGRGQHQDTGAKAIHLAPDTTSRITSKSVCKDGGRTSYRGLLHVAKGAKRVKSSVRCDALILDDRSRTDTYPYNEIHEDDATVTHEATVGKIGEDQIFYLMSRGIPEQDALNMIVLGFLESFTKTLPMEYAIEFNRLIELEMSGSVG